MGQWGSGQWHPKTLLHCYNMLQLKLIPGLARQVLCIAPSIGSLGDTAGTTKCSRFLSVLLATKPVLAVLLWPYRPAPAVLQTKIWDPNSMDVDGRSQDHICALHWNPALKAQCEQGKFAAALFLGGFPVDCFSGPVSHPPSTYKIMQVLRSHSISCSILELKSLICLHQLLATWS